MPRILKYVSHQKFPLTASLLIFLSHCFLNPPCLLLFGFYLLICLSSIFFFHRSRISNHRLLNARHQFGKKKIIFTVILKFFLLIWSQKEFLLFRVTISFFFFHPAAGLHFQMQDSVSSSESCVAFKSFGFLFTSLGQFCFLFKNVRKMYIFHCFLSAK